MIMLVILKSRVNWEKTEIHNLNYGVWHSRFSYHFLCVVRSLREGDFHLYIQALQKIAPLMFALDHPNYARWLLVHIRDMLLLNECHLNVAAEFRKDNFVVKKTQHAFSGILLDHAHEQNNKLVKVDGGAGLAQNSSQLLGWMVSGPEVAS